MSAFPQRPPVSDAARRRLTLAAWVPRVVVAGLLGRFVLPGAVGDVSGGVAYAALVYVLVALVWPGARSAAVAVAAFAVSAAVELFQLTSVPADLAEAFSPARLVLGTGFNGWDFLAYAAGAALAWGVDEAVRRPRPSGV